MECSFGFKGLIPCNVICNCIVRYRRAPPHPPFWGPWINARRALLRLVSHYFQALPRRIEVGINARRATLSGILDLKIIGDVPSHGASRICLLPSTTPRSAAPAFLARLSFCNLRRTLRGLSQIACSYLLF
jgi:hypothetical protein